MLVPMLKCLEESALYLSQIYPYYYEFFQVLHISENSRVKTIGVNASITGFNLFYNKEFVEKLTKEELTFVVIHELLHLLHNHINRSKVYDKHASNIAEDMIINKLIIDNVCKKDKNIVMPTKGCILPKEYTGKLLFEFVYEWLMTKNPKDKDLSKETSDMLKNLQDMQTLDEHLDNEISEELKEIMVDKILEQAIEKARGFGSSDFETIVKTLRKSKINYLKEIQKEISNMVGHKKVGTWSKPNRKGISGTKGYKKNSCEFNVILDTSGSMNNEFEKVLDYLFYNEIIINLIQIDTEVKEVKQVTNKNQLKKLVIKGGGGTTLQPGIDMIVNDPYYSKFPLAVLTDGYTDTLDFSGLKKKSIVLTVDREVPILKGEVKQICIKKN